MEQRFREEIVRVARSWIGTPFTNEVVTKGVGTCCVALIKAIHSELHGIPLIHHPFHSAEYLENTVFIPGNEYIADSLDKFMERSEGRGLAQVVAMRDSTFQGRITHAAVITGDNTIIHATRERGVAEDTVKSVWLNLDTETYNFIPPDVITPRGNTLWTRQRCKTTTEQLEDLPPHTPVRSPPPLNIRRQRLF